MSWFLIHYMHVFECDAVVRPLCPMANLFVGVFVWALAPFCVSGLLSLLTKRKSGWGICGSSGWSVWWLVCCDLPAFPGLIGPCTNGVFTAYAHVRTEPQCDIGHTRKKKWRVQFWSLFGPFNVANLLRRLFQVEADLISNSCGWNLELGRPIFARLLFLTFWGPKKGPFFVILFCSNFHSLEALKACREACPDVFCSNFHGLATLEFKTCIGACLQLCSSYNFFGLLQFP